MEYRSNSGPCRGGLKQTMSRDDIVLAALAASNGATHTPVQIQKLLFLIARRVDQSSVDGPHFNFVPYDYGPFDSQVYRCLESLSAQGLVEIVEEADLRWKKYRTSEQGLKQGMALLSSLPQPVSDYIKELSTFVRRLTFAELVSSIYRAYPEMRERSVFQG